MDTLKNLIKVSKKYKKIKFNLDDELPLNKTIVIHNATIVVGVVFHQNNKYYLQVFLEECL